MVEGIILGIIQGLSEFIPVSSTGHLVLAREVFGIGADSGLAFDAVLQLATAGAIFVYFFRDIAKLASGALATVMRKSIPAEESMQLKAIVVGTIPAVIAGVLLETYMETVFRTSIVVASMLIAGSVLMLAAEWSARRGSEPKQLSVARGFWIGAFQSLALIPGISRSGATISGGLFLGLSREAAARFSFLLAFPIIVGSGMKKLLDLLESGALESQGASLLAGSIAAFFVGLAAIHFLIRYLKNHTLGIFILYRIMLAVIILLAV